MARDARFALLVLVGVALYAGWRSFGEGRGVERFLLRMGVLDDVTVFIDPPAPLSSGTAFHLGDGRWATARHVVDACSRIGLQRPAARRFDEARLVGLSQAADSAVISSVADDPALLALDRPLSRGEVVSLVGFPQGRPATVRARFLGPAVVRMRGGDPVDRFDERQFLFEEIARSPRFGGPLGGLSGGPAVTDDGRVAGLTSAASLDGRQILVSPIARVWELVAPPRGERGEAVSGETADWRRFGDDLRRNGAVRLTACVVETS